jgi:general stress protein 26
LKGDFNPFRKKEAGGKHKLFQLRNRKESLFYQQSGKSMENNSKRAEGLQKLKEKIKDIKVAMLTSVKEDGTLHSRPMYTQEMKDDGVLWFFTGGGSGKASEINSDAHVNLGYADPPGNVYVAVCGRGVITRDKSKIDELWSDTLTAWFPEGKDDPNIALLKVEIESAEYWDTPHSKVVELIGMAKAAITGEPFKPGKHGSVEL